MEFKLAEIRWGATLPHSLKKYLLQEQKVARNNLFASLHFALVFDEFGDLPIAKVVFEASLNCCASVFFPVSEHGVLLYEYFRVNLLLELF